MTVIGLCGGSGAGKTTVLSVFELCGSAPSDTDRGYRDICVPNSPCICEIRAFFGDGVIAPSGELDRKALGSIIYNDAEKREALNNITHRYIRLETERRIEEFRGLGYESVTVDAPLLFESGFDKMCDVTVGVVSDEKIRIARIMSRDGITEEHALSRIRAQYSDEYLKERCEYIIENNGTRCGLVLSSAAAYEKIINGK